MACRRQSRTEMAGDKREDRVYNWVLKLVGRELTKSCRKRERKIKREKRKIDRQRDKELNGYDTRRWLLRKSIQ